MKSILIKEKAAQQIKDLVANQEKLQQHINSFVQGLASALEVPDGWVFDLNLMGFRPSESEPEATNGTVDPKEIVLEE